MQYNFSAEESVLITLKHQLLAPKYLSICVHGLSFHIVPGPAIAISNMRGVDSLNYSKAEKVLRCKLAAAYRLVDMFGWSDGVNANISVSDSDVQHISNLFAGNEYK